jgi:hypothetical protein
MIKTSNGYGPLRRPLTRSDKMKITSSRLSGNPKLSFSRNWKLRRGGSTPAAAEEMAFAAAMPASALSAFLRERTKFCSRKSP